MRWMRWIAGIGLLVAIGLAVSGPAAAESRKEMCLVCKVKHGESHEEPVRAVRTYEGKEYGFCSEACAREFEADAVAYIPPSFPRPAPAFSLVALDGTPVSTESLKGRVVLLDFWATWCAPCRKSMPELQALHRKYADRGFSVVGISIDEDGPAKVRKFAKSRKVTYPIALDSKEQPAWDAYRVKAVPAAFLLDRQGRIVAQWTGIPADAGELESRLATLLAVD